MRINVIKSLFTAATLALLAMFGMALGKRALRVPVCELADKFPKKNLFIELNGGVSRLAGRRLCNNVYRSPDGMLLTENKRGDENLQETIAGNAIAFARWLECRRVPYLYVQTPAKIDMAGTMLPTCLVHFGNVKADAFIAALSANGVPNLDLRPALSSTTEDVGRYFYKSDHHWNSDAVFRAFGIIVTEITPLLKGNPQTVEPYLRPDAWSREVIPRCFMGSSSRRTGRLFGGVDDMIVYEPRFQTEMTLEIPAKSISLTGDFRGTAMYRAHELRPGVVRKDAYSLAYTGTGGSHNIVRHLNPNAPLKRKLLLVGDSFARPLECLLSTVLSEVIAVDQRSFKTGETVVGYVESLRPDIVLQLNNPFALGNKGKQRRPVLFEYGNPR